MRRAAILLTMGAAFLLACGRSGPQQKTVTTDTVTIDRLYATDAGPRSQQEVMIQDGYPRALFLTGADVRVVGEGQKVQELLQGASLRWYNPGRHGKLVGWAGNPEPNVFCFCQGVQNVSLPPGYGIPCQSNEPLSLVVQWHNDDLYRKSTVVHLELTLHYTTGQELHPLRPTAAFGLACVDGAEKGAYYGADESDDLGPGCIRGEKLDQAPVFQDRQGRSFQSVWTLPHGQQTNRTLIDNELIRPLSLRAVAPYFAPGLRSLRLSPNVYEFDPKHPVRLIPEGLVLGAEAHLELACTFENLSKVNRRVGALVMLYADATKK